MWLLLLSSLFAEEKACDVDASLHQIVHEHGDLAAQSFHDLVKCDEVQAKRFITTTIPIFLPSEIGFTAAVDAIEVGGTEFVRNWVHALGTSNRDGFLKEVGKRCSRSSAIQDYLVDINNSGDVFWTDDYYAHLDSCRVQKIQALLQQKVETGVLTDPDYLPTALVLAKNLESASIPVLEARLQNAEDEQEQAQLVTAIHTAVTISNTNHADDKKLVRDVTILGIETIHRYAHLYKPEAILAARAALQEFGAEAEADGLAGMMYKPYQQQDGSYMWGLLVVENATCKKGKEKQRIHVSSLTETGNNWRDQLDERISGSMGLHFGLDLATTCRGTGETKLVISDTPLSNLDQLKVWQEEQVLLNRNPSVKKVATLKMSALEM